MIEAFLIMLVIYAGICVIIVTSALLSQLLDVIKHIKKGQQ